MIIGVSDSFWPAKIMGGPIFANFALYNELGNQGVSPCFVFSTTKGCGQDCCSVSTYAGGKIIVSYNRFFLSHKISVSLWFNLLRFLVRCTGDASKIKVMHLTGSFSLNILVGCIFARLFGIPMIWSPRGSLQFESDGFKAWLKNVWLKTFTRFGGSRLHIHVTSSLEAESIDNKINVSRIAVIANGVDAIASSNVFVGSSLDLSQRSPPGETLLFLGRIDRKKQIEVILRALVGLPQYRLDIAGEGDPVYTRELKQLIVSLGVSHRVAWLGFVEGPSKETAFAKARYLVMPSRVENFGNVVTEALARGIPVIASRSTPWINLKNNNCGDWIEASPEALMNSVMQLDRASWVSLSEKAKKYSLSFSWQSMAKEFRNLIDNVGKK